LEATEYAERMLSRIGFTMADVTVQLLSVKTDELERLDLQDTRHWWSPHALPLVEAPTKRKRKDVEADALERYERRALSRRKPRLEHLFCGAKEAEDRKHPSSLSATIERSISRLANSMLGSGHPAQILPIHLLRSPVPI
jgi:hypothetical protein